VLGRVFLHAHRLRFRSPSTGAEIAVSAELPRELHAYLDLARHLANRSSEHK